MINSVAYLQSRRQYLQNNVSNEWADMVLNRMDPDFVICTLDSIPNTVPAKFHARMQDTLLTAYLRVLFERATYKYTLAQKHAFIQQVFEYSRKCRES